MGERLERRLGRIPPLAVDAALGALLTLLSLRLAHAHYPEGYRPFDATAFALTAGANLPLAFRRWAPLAVLLASAGSVAAFLAAGYWPALNQLGPPLALYTLATLRPRRQVLLAAAVVAPVMVAGSLRSWNGDPADILVQTAAWIVILITFGGSARRHAERGERLAVLTAQLRREQEDRERRAVTDERMRIARELHDVVAHHLAVISVQTGLAWYVFDSDPPTARTALRTTSDVGREALDEMRRLLAVLRVDAESDGHTGSEDGPWPGLGDLDRLAERVRRAGVPVTLVVTGSVRPLPQGIELCAYRVIQESLTNVVRHARPAAATVEVVHGAHELTVRITDHGHERPGGPSTRPPVARPAGHGLIGMRERARIYGSTLRAGPRADGHPGFEVELVVPVVPASDEAAGHAAIVAGEP
jgi:signal transduction histidine kinase